MKSCECNAPLVETARNPARAGKSGFVCVRMWNPNGTVLHLIHTKHKKPQIYENIMIVCSRCGSTVQDFEEFCKE